VIGIDIGGSKTHGVRYSAGQIQLEAFSGSANISSVGVIEAVRQLELLVSQLGRDDVHAVCVGAAGVDTPQAEQRLRALLEESFPSVPTMVVHDTQLVLAAAGLAEGAVAISGTGSAAWGRNAQGAEARASGWGYLLGDDGSAYGVIRAALRHALRRTDAGEPADALTRELVRACAVDSPGQLLELFYSTPSRREWAAKAGLVFALAEAGDVASMGVVQGAAGELVQAVIRVCRRLRLTGPVVLAGGLAVHQPLLQDAVRRGLRSADIDDVRVLRTDPVHGAVALALEALSGRAETCPQ
jgi:N-acetylglucosamine kinase-like BadF-type ATPase